MFWIILGGVIVAFTLYDALLTTIAPRRAGPISKRLAHGWWQTSLRIYRKTGVARVLSIAGPTILVLITILWVVGLWGGWTMIYSAHPDAVVNADTRIPATLLERVYYAGFVLFTLGTGDYVPNGDLWRMLTNVTTFTGLSVVTLALTFCLTAVGAIAFKRALAGTISNLGKGPGDILVSAWDGQKIAGLDQQLVQLASQVETHNQQDQAYPILHYFYSAEQRNALAPSLGRLSEALFLLHAVDPGVLPSPGTVIPLRRAIDRLLDRIDLPASDTAAEPPDPPSLEEIEQAGIPVSRPDEFRRIVDAERKFRSEMLRFVRDDGWDWKDVDCREDDNG